MLGVVGCHATSKGVELSYKLGYLFTASIFRLICHVCPDIIRILLISTFRGHYPHFLDVSILRGYYLHIVDIMDIRISWIFFTLVTLQATYIVMPVLSFTFTHIV